VELAALDAMAAEGLVPADAPAACRRAAPRWDERAARRLTEIEAEVRHDFLAFVQYCEETVGEPARYLHRGLTSSDVLARQSGASGFQALAQAVLGSSGMGNSSHRTQSTQIVVDSFLQALGGMNR
jgi:adenylosuccinate lyase